MSDYYQELAFDAIPPDEAEAATRRAIQWLIAEGVIAPELTDCVLGGDNELGHPPGPNWRNATGDAERPDDALFFQLDTNGIECRAGRHVSTAGGHIEETNPGKCPACGGETSEGFDIFDLADRWFEGEDISLDCPICIAASRLEDWDFTPNFAFGFVSITVWNWPELSPGFVERLSQAIGASRVRRIFGAI